MFNSFYFLT